MTPATDPGRAVDGARRLRLLVPLLALLCLLTGALLGWTLRDIEPARVPTYLEQLSATLSLRPAQVAAIEAVLAEEDRDIDALLGAKLGELHAPVAERRARTEAELLAALDVQQRTRYEELMQAGDVAGSGGSRER